MKDLLPIWRVRKIACDGRRLGKTWQENFFSNADDAEQFLRDTIAASDERNPKYPYEKNVEGIENVWGYCNWQFGLMVTLDKFWVNQKKIQATY